MNELKIFKDMEANCANCPFDITEGDIKRCYDDCGDKPNECYECSYLEYYLKSEADKEIAHHKYKRCLDEAKICQLRLACYEHYVARCINDNSPTFKRYQFLRNHYKKWYKSWLTLAAEPTWAKFLQLIRKEDKV